jgi:hypothetical protein
VAAGGAGLALALGLAVSVARPPAPGSAGPAAPDADGAALAAAAPDVAGRGWLVHRGDDRWAWGRVGVRERRVLPDGESGLAAGDRWLASAVSTPAGTTVRVRDLATGAVVLERRIGFRPGAAAFAGDQLLVTGYLAGEPAGDGGIVAIGVPGGALRTIVAPGPFPARLGDHPSKGDVHVSGTGRLAAANTCGSLGCDDVVVDVATLTARTPRAGAPGFLRAVTDEALVLTDADGAWIKGVDARTGREAFTVAGASLMEPASMADGRVVADVGRHDRGWQVAALDGHGRLSAITDAASAPGPWVWPSVSSPTVAALGDVPFDTALGAGDAAATLVRGSDLGRVGTFVVQPGE